MMVRTLPYFICTGVVLMVSSMEAVGFRKYNGCQGKCAEYYCQQEYGDDNTFELCKAPGFMLRIDQGTVDNGQPITVQVTPIGNDPLQIYWSIDEGNTWESTGNRIVYCTKEPGLVNFTVVAVNLENGSKSEPQRVSARVLKPNALAKSDKAAEPEERPKKQKAESVQRGGGYFWDGKKGCWELDAELLSG